MMFSMDGTVMMEKAMHALMNEEVRLLCLPAGIRLKVSIVTAFTLCTNSTITDSKRKKEPATKKNRLKQFY